jgi:hypothetical protein
MILIQTSVKPETTITRAKCQEEEVNGESAMSIVHGERWDEVI